jgi:hypothetical protein
VNDFDVCRKFIKDFDVNAMKNNIDSKQNTDMEKKENKKETDEITKSIDEFMAHHVEFCSFCAILHEMGVTFYKKNHDYGNSFNKSMDEFGITAAVVRMSDKMERLKTLSKTDAKVADEKIEDTLLDLANYAVMTVMYLRGKKDGEAEQK